MSYEVVVVGAGIGGLTAASLLSARGMSVCVLERQSQVGGCIGRVQFGGLDFDPGMGIYPGWGSGEVYDRLFSELPVEPPQASPVDTDYVVRLGFQDIRLKRDDAEFFEELRGAFPECLQEAIDFYKEVIRLSTTTSEPPKNQKKVSNPFRKWLGLNKSRPAVAKEDSASSLTLPTSDRFQRFIAAQLRAFLHTSFDRCSFVAAAHALSLPRRGLYSIAGGIAALPERLAESIRKSGGTVRLNSPVLRLSYNEKGEAVGVDLLNGETIFATRAVIANLTVWDTFGKLVGLNRTPATTKSILNKIEGSGAYIIYAAVEPSALGRLPSRHFLVAPDESFKDENLSSEIALTIGCETGGGLCAATIKTAIDVAPWFDFQTSEEDYEQWDQSALEKFWEELHRAVPEFGSDIEVIETANPRTFYDLSRRKLGMVIGAAGGPSEFDAAYELNCLFPNVFLVGDTVSKPQIADVVEHSIALANRLTK